MGRSRYKITEDGAPHFLTCTTIRWIPIFTRVETVEIVLRSLRFLQTEERLLIFGYVVLENHLHLIASGRELGKAIGSFKSYTARRIIDLLDEKKVRPLLQQLAFHKARHKADRNYQLWQEGSHPQRIHSRDMMRQKLEYIHQNPVKRGYVDEAVHWRCSSARNYAGMEGLLDVVTDW